MVVMEAVVSGAGGGGIDNGDGGNGSCPFQINSSQSV
jgi:hypothetical protein